MENKYKMYYRVMRTGGSLSLIFMGSIPIKIKTEMLFTSLFSNHRFKAHRRSSLRYKYKKENDKFYLNEIFFNNFVLI